MIRSFAVIALFLCSFVSLLAQNNPYTDSLKTNLKNSSTDKDKVLWLGLLSQYYIALDKKLSDEYASQQQEVAELSRDRSLIVLAWLSNARRHYNVSGQQNNINKAIEYSQKGLDLAKESHLDDYTAWSFIYLALGARLNGDNDKALNYNNLAVSLAINSASDSLKISAYNSLAYTYLNKDEKMLAFRNYLQALDLAEQNGSYTTLKNCYSNMSVFYSELGDSERAKDYLFKALELTTRFNNKWIDRLEVYNNLGRIYANNKQIDLAKNFYEKSLALADARKFETVKINTYSLMIDMYASNNQVKEGLDFFNSKSELKTFMRNAGFDYFIDQAYGMAYTEMGVLDSAYYYLKKAEPAFMAKANRFNLHWFYNNMSKYYCKKTDYKNALAYSLKAKGISDVLDDLSIKKNMAQNLDSIYQQLGDFKNAYKFNREYQHYKDSLEKLSAEKDLMLLEVENENKRKEREALADTEARRTRHNIQYMGITAAIAGVFIVLIMFGFFSVSHATIRILGFFAFIFLFEFIILLADNQIHHWTHGEPWKILAIKIGLISILLPLHHFMEEKVIHYLTSKKMLELNKTGLFSKLSSPKEEINP